MSFAKFGILAFLFAAHAQAYACDHPPCDHAPPPCTEGQVCQTDDPPDHDGDGIPDREEEQEPPRCTTPACVASSDNDLPEECKQAFRRSLNPETAYKCAVYYCSSHNPSHQKNAYCRKLHDIVGQSTLPKPCNGSATRRVALACMTRYCANPANAHASVCDEMREYGPSAPTGASGASAATVDNEKRDPKPNDAAPPASASGSSGTSRQIEPAR